MDIDQIIETLEDNGLSEVEELEYKEDIKVVRFFYDYDKDEISAAKAYTEDEGEGLSKEKKLEELYIPYLNDLAVDNVGEILEDIMEEERVDAQFITYDINEEEDYSEFIAVFHSKGKAADIEKVLEDLKL